VLLTFRFHDRTGSEPSAADGPIAKCVKVSMVVVEKAAASKAQAPPILLPGRGRQTVLTPAPPSPGRTTQDYQVSLDSQEGEVRLTVPLL